MSNRLTRITTRTGDRGTSRLAGGKALPKTDVIFAALGAVDELNSAIGHALSLLPDADGPPGSEYAGSPDVEPSAEPSGEPSFDSAARVQAIRASLGRVQSRLFDLGGGLAMPNAGVSLAGELEALAREGAATNAELPPLKEFVLPGGCPAGAALHLARAICRRAERDLWVVQAERPGDYDDSLPVYLNRLGDVLFIFARSVNRAAGAPEPQWQPLPHPNRPPQP